MNPDVHKKVIVPGIVKRNVVVIGISSIDVEDNFWTHLLKKKNIPMVNRYLIYYVCVVHVNTVEETGNKSRVLIRDSLDGSRPITEIS